jgi:hypothetical protein
VGNLQALRRLQRFRSGNAAIVLGFVLQTGSIAGGKEFVGKAAQLILKSLAEREGFESA